MKTVRNGATLLTQDGNSASVQLFTDKIAAASVQRSLKDLHAKANGVFGMTIKDEASFQVQNGKIEFSSKRYALKSIINNS